MKCYEMYFHRWSCTIRTSHSDLISIDAAPQRSAEAQYD